MPGAGVDAGAACSFADSTAVDTTITCTDDGEYTATLTVSDGVNPPVSDSVVVTVVNVAPAVSALMAPPGPIFVGDTVTFGATGYTDPGANDTHTAEWSWGDGTTTPVAASSGSAAGASHVYVTPGAYTVRLTVMDDDGEPGFAEVTITVLPICGAGDVLDNFNRANGGLGANWRGATSGYRIVGNQVDVRNGGAIYWQPTSFGADQTACVTLTRIDPKSRHHTLMLKVQGFNDWTKGVILVSYDGVSRRVTAEARDVHNARWILIGSFVPPNPVADGDQLGARALADGTLRVFVNNTLVGTANAGIFYAGKGGQVGLWYLNAWDAWLDDFSGR